MDKKVKERIIALKREKSKTNDPDVHATLDKQIALLKKSLVPVPGKGKASIATAVKVTKKGGIR